MVICYLNVSQFDLNPGTDTFSWSCLVASVSVSDVSAPLYGQWKRAGEGAPATQETPEENCQVQKHSHIFLVSCLLKFWQISNLFFCLFLILENVFYGISKHVLHFSAQHGFIKMKWLCEMHRYLCCINYATHCTWKYNVFHNRIKAEKEQIRLEEEQKIEKMRQLKDDRLEMSKREFLILQRLRLDEEERAEAKQRRERARKTRESTR